MNVVSLIDSEVVKIEITAMQVATFLEGKKKLNTVEDNGEKREKEILSNKIWTGYSVTVI